MMWFDTLGVIACFVVGVMIGWTDGRLVKGKPIFRSGGD
jgi:F0F1-type ATP synthase assembly protein I